MEILIPIATTRAVRKMNTASLALLTGTRVGIVSNGWRSMEAMTPHLSQRLKEKYGASEISLYSVHINKPITDDTLDSIERDCDAVIVGLAN